MRALAGVAPLAALLSACSFQGPSTDGTAFACAEATAACPSGYVCDDGVCVADPGAPDAAAAIDAAPDSPDARPAPDGGGPDARPAPVTRTAIFGDHSLATVKGTLFDTFIDASAPGNAPGGSNFISIDTDPLRYALMRIDVSTIPSGSVVESAEIVITLFDAQEDGRIEAQVLRRAWDERAATFMVSDTGTSWPAPGANGSAIDSAVVAATDGRAATDQVLALDIAVVQDWVDSPASNFGLRLRSTSQTNRGSQWHSREEGVATRRPYLRVTYREP
jgi:hypothetical protein